MGGSEVTPYSIPWQVVTEVNGIQNCGGTLISNRHVLTAAHCRDREFVIVAKHSLTDKTDGIRKKVCKTTIHPNYNMANKDNDFAILHLEEPVLFGARVAPACLPSRRFDGGWSGLNWIETNRTMTVSGWGLLNQEDLKQSSTLHSVKVPGVTNSHCDELLDMHDYGLAITSNMLCAGDIENGKIDACKGDSGGL